MSRIIKYENFNRTITDGCCIELDSKEKILVYYTENRLCISKVWWGKFPSITGYKTIITVTLKKKLETELYKILSGYLKERIDWGMKPCPRRPIYWEPSSIVDEFDLDFREQLDILDKIVNVILPFKSTKDIKEAFYNK